MRKFGPGLTPRERDVLHFLLEGLSNKDMAQVLSLSPRTVEIHRASILEKYGVKNATELAFRLQPQASTASDAEAKLHSLIKRLVILQGQARSLNRSMALLLSEIDTAVAASRPEHFILELRDEADDGAPPAE